MTETSSTPPTSSATVIVAGSRNIFDRFDDHLSDDNIHALVARCLHVAPVDRANVGELVHGANNNSPDAWGKTWASFRSDVDDNPFKAQWNDIDHPDALVREGQYGKYDAKAGLRRNTEMARYAAEQPGASTLIAFWDGQSSGTEHMIEQAKERNVDVCIFRLDDLSVRKALLNGILL